MSSEQAIKALQAQNAQFQELVMSLAQGQQELKTLLLKKKKKERIGVATLGRRFEGEARRVLEFPPTSEEGTSKGKGAAVPSESEVEEEAEEDEDYSEQQYPPADDKYKSLEDRLAAMELQRVPGLDFEDLGLVAGIVISPKFKVPVFASMTGFPAQKCISDHM